MSNLKRPWLRLPDDAPIERQLLEMLNDRFRSIEEALAAQAGHAGPVLLNSDLDLRGHRIKNVGKPRESDDATPASHVDSIASFSSAQALLQQFLIDIGELDGADELFDSAAPGQVQTISLVWKKKAGWVARWSEPVNVVKVFGYFVSFFNDAGGLAWMDAETGAAVASQAAAERFVEQNSYRTSLSVENLASPFSTTGVKVRIVPLVKIKGQGKTRGKPADYGALVAPGSDGADDTAPASAVQGLSLTWGAKKKGWKATWQPPATNWKSAGKYYKVVYFDNAGANFMNPHTGQVASPNTEAGATIKEPSTHHTTHLEAGQVAAQFQAGVKVKVTPVNLVNGVETDGASSTSALVGINGEDVGPASAVQNLVLRWNNKKGWKATWDKPATNANSIVGYKAVYFDNAAANFMNSETGALAAPNTENGATRRVVDDHHTTHVKFSDVAAQFTAGVKVKITPINIVAGIETDGAAATSSLVAPVNDDAVPVDTAAPGNLPTPTLKFKRGKLRAVIDMSGVTNAQTIKDRYELAIHDGTDSLDLSDPDSETKVAGIVFYPVGAPGVSVAANLDQTVRIFSASAVLKCRFRLTNNVGPATSADSAGLVLASQQDVTTLYNPNNILRNGHFTYHDGSIAKRWEDYDPRSATFGNVDQTGKLRFDKNEHRAKWRDTPNQDNQRFLVQNLGRIFMKSEYYSALWNMYSNGTPRIDEVVVGLYTQKTLSNNISGVAGTNTVSGSGFITDGVKAGTVIGENNVGQWRTVVAVSASSITVDRNWGSSFGPTPGFALIPQGTRLSQTNVALSTADKFQKGLILTDSDLDTSLDIYFVVILRDIVDTTTFPFIDAICMNAGQESAGYQRSVDSFETNDAGTSEDFDSAPTGGSSSGGAQLKGGSSGDPGEILPIL